MYVVFFFHFFFRGNREVRIINNASKQRCHPPINKHLPEPPSANKNWRPTADIDTPLPPCVGPLPKRWSPGSVVSVSAHPASSRTFLREFLSLKHLASPTGCYTYNGTVVCQWGWRAQVGKLENIRWIRVDYPHLTFTKTWPRLSLSLKINNLNQYINSFMLARCQPFSP